MINEVLRTYATAKTQTDTTHNKSTQNHNGGKVVAKGRSKILVILISTLIVLEKRLHIY